MTKEESALIDEYGELQRRIDAFRPVVARHKTIKESISSWCEDQPDETLEFDGGLYRVQVGPRALQRTIASMRRIYRALGATKFLEWCTFPLTALDKLIADQSGYVEETRTGPRAVKAVLKEAAAVKPAKKAA